MANETYINFLHNHIDDCESEIRRLRRENHELYERVKHLNNLMACYRSRISDLEDILEGEDYEE